MRPSQAHHAVYVALTRGILARQPCAECGAEPAEAHHPDYSRPLDVIWVCRRHHKALYHSGSRGKKTLTEGLRFSVTPEVRDALRAIAQRDDRSVAAIIRRAIRELLERESAKEAA